MSRGQENNWMHSALCLQVDPELFFPEAGQSSNSRHIRAAIAVCHRCEVRETCLQFALDNRITDGIWGGQLPTHRRGRYKPAKDPAHCAAGHFRKPETTSASGRCLICQRIFDARRRRTEYDRG